MSQARFANMEAEMQQRIDQAVAENEQRMKGQREASEKNVHFSARVVALNSRMSNLQKQLKETQNRERALMEELDEARQAGMMRQHNDPLPNGGNLILILPFHRLSSALLVVAAPHSSQWHAGCLHLVAYLSAFIVCISWLIYSFNALWSLMRIYWLSRCSRSTNTETTWKIAVAGTSNHANKPGTPTASVRSLDEDALSARSSHQYSMQPLANSILEPGATSGPYRDFAGGATALNETQDRAMANLTTATLTRRLPVLNIQYGEACCPSLPLLQALFLATISLTVHSHFVTAQSEVCCSPAQRLGCIRSRAISTRLTSMHQPNALR